MTVNCFLCNENLPHQFNQTINYFQLGSAGSEILCLLFNLPKDEFKSQCQKLLFCIGCKNQIDLYNKHLTYFRNMMESSRIEIQEKLSNQISTGDGGVREDTTAFSRKLRKLLCRNFKLSESPEKEGSVSVPNVRDKEETAQLCGDVAEGNDLQRNQVEVRTQGDIEPSTCIVEEGDEGILATTEVSQVVAASTENLEECFQKQRKVMEDASQSSVGSVGSQILKEKVSMDANVELNIATEVFSSPSVPSCSYQGRIVKTAQPSKSQENKDEPIHCGLILESSTRQVLDTLTSLATRNNLSLSCTSLLSQYASAQHKNWMSGAATKCRKGNIGAAKSRGVYGIKNACAEEDMDATMIVFCQDTSANVSTTCPNDNVGNNSDENLNSVTQRRDDKNNDTISHDSLRIRDATPTADKKHCKVVYTAPSSNKNGPNASFCENYNIRSVVAPASASKLRRRSRSTPTTSACRSSEETPNYFKGMLKTEDIHTTLHKKNSSKAAKQKLILDEEDEANNPSLSQCYLRIGNIVNHSNVNGGKCGSVKKPHVSATANVLGSEHLNLAPNEESKSEIDKGSEKVVNLENSKMVPCNNLATGKSLSNDFKTPGTNSSEEDSLNHPRNMGSADDTQSLSGLVPALASSHSMRERHLRLARMERDTASKSIHTQTGVVKSTSSSSKRKISAEELNEDDNIPSAKSEKIELAKVIWKRRRLTILRSQTPKKIERMVRNETVTSSEKVSSNNTPAPSTSKMGSLNITSVETTELQSVDLTPGGRLRPLRNCTVRSLAVREEQNNTKVSPVLKIKTDIVEATGTGEGLRNSKTNEIVGKGRILYPAGSVGTPRKVGRPRKSEVARRLNAVYVPVPKNKICGKRTAAEAFARLRTNPLSTLDKTGDGQNIHFTPRPKTRTETATAAVVVPISSLTDVEMKNTYTLVPDETIGKVVILSPVEEVGTPSKPELAKIQRTMNATTEDKNIHEDRTAQVPSVELRRCTICLREAVKPCQSKKELEQHQIIHQVEQNKNSNDVEQREHSNDSEQRGNVNQTAHPQNSNNLDQQKNGNKVEQNQILNNVKQSQNTNRIERLQNLNEIEHRQYSREVDQRQYSNVTVRRQYSKNVEQHQHSSEVVQRQNSNVVQRQDSNAVDHPQNSNEVVQRQNSNDLEQRKQTDVVDQLQTIHVVKHRQNSMVVEHRQNSNKVEQSRNTYEKQQTKNAIGIEQPQNSNVDRLQRSNVVVQRQNSNDVEQRKQTPVVEQLKSMHLVEHRQNSNSVEQTQNTYEIQQHKNATGIEQLQNSNVERLQRSNVVVPHKNSNYVEQLQNTHVVKHGQNSKEVEQRQNSKEVEQRQNTKEVEQRQNSKEVKQRQNSNEVEQRQITHEVVQRTNANVVEQRKITNAASMVKLRTAIVAAATTVSLIDRSLRNSNTPVPNEAAPASRVLRPRKSEEARKKQNLQMLLKDKSNGNSGGEMKSERKKDMHASFRLKLKCNNMASPSGKFMGSNPDVPYEKISRLYSTGGKIHTCDVCRKKYTRTDYMINHILKLHSHEISKCFRCPVCEYTSTSNAFMNLHMESIHGTNGQFLCEVCGVRFKYEKHLEDHRETHETKCDVQTPSTSSGGLGGD